MLSYIVKRLIISSVVLVLITILTFIIVQLAPGGPEILLDESLTAADRDQIRQNLGLDQPILIQYTKWFSNMMRGDMGMSFSDKIPVSRMIRQSLPNTLLLTVTALLIAIIIGVPLGTYTAYHPNTVSDYILSFSSMVGLSIPSFWFGIILIIIFAVNMRVLPSAGMYTIGEDRTFPDLLVHMIMPAFVSAVSPLAQIVRYTRSSVLEVLNQDYIRTARAKGLTEARTLLVHALKNAIIPIITTIGLMLPHLVGGSVIIEKIFAWPGMGRLIADAAFKRDYPVVMSATFLVASIVVASNLTIDIIYGFLNPKIRLE